jgi:uncharacterized protein YdhG (YjbR/CyaY superfamily)
MKSDVQKYIAAIGPEYRPLFDRLQKLVLKVHPEAEVSFSYKMPKYAVGKRRIFLAVWQHGVSIYGVGPGADSGFIARHRDLIASRGTIRLRPKDAAAIPDDEFREMFRAALD